MGINEKTCGSEVRQEAVRLVVVDSWLVDVEPL